MPIVALGLNIAWEATFSFIYPHHSPQVYVNIIWFAVDCLILIQVLWFGPREFPKQPLWRFYLVVVLTVGSCFAIIITVTLQLVDFDGAYSAFSQNLVMSILFCAMLQSRGSMRGQHVAVGVLKGLGTALASIGFCFFAGYATPYYTYFLGISILIFDVVYVIYASILTHRERKNAKGACCGCAALCRAAASCPPLPCCAPEIDNLPREEESNDEGDDSKKTLMLNVFPLLS